MTKELLPGLLAVEGIPKNASHFGIAFDNEALNFLVPSEYVDGGVTAKSIHFNATGNLKVLGSGTADKITEDEWAGVEKGINYVVCPACGGDGKETCSNPDHGFIEAMPGEVGRLGCPGCGHDPKHKVNRGKNVCPECGGHGMVVKDLFEEYCRETGYDNEPIEVSKTASGLSLLASHNLNPSTTVLLTNKK